MMMEKNEFCLTLPKNYRVIKNADCLILQKQITVTNKKTKERTKEWGFVGYHSVLESAIGQYLRVVPLESLGAVTVKEYKEFMVELREEIYNIVPKGLNDWNE